MNWAKIIALLAASVVAAGAQTQPPPQTARQALLEMFLSKSPNALEKHLPVVALNALRKVGTEDAAIVLHSFATLSQELERGGAKLQTFDVGPTLIISEDRRTLEKTEIVVERDDLSGDQDEIEVSLQLTKDGQPTSLPVLPRITFLFKEESGTWRLTELIFTARVPLSDPDYLKGVLGEMLHAQGDARQSTAAAGIRTLLTAELAYQTTFPNHGYACSLGELGGAGQERESNEHHAILIDNTLASGNKGGYVYTITDCSPTGFHLTAVPSNPESGGRAFCADESQVIRTAADGKATTCWSTGESLQ